MVRESESTGRASGGKADQSPTATRFLKQLRPTFQASFTHHAHLMTQTNYIYIYIILALKLGLCTSQAADRADNPENSKKMLAFLFLCRRSSSCGMTVTVKRS